MLETNEVAFRTKVNSVKSELQILLTEVFKDLKYLYLMN